MLGLAERIGCFVADIESGMSAREYVQWLTLANEENEAALNQQRINKAEALLHGR